MASVSANNNNDDMLRCPITLDYFVDPVTTPCGHTFSREAIGSFLMANDEAMCPSCRNPLDEWNYATTSRNYTIASMVDTATASATTAVEETTSLPQSWAGRLTWLDAGDMSNVFSRIGRLSLQADGKMMRNKTLVIAVNDISGSMGNAMGQVRFALRQLIDFTFANKEKMRSVIVIYDDRCDERDRWVIDTDTANSHRNIEYARVDNLYVRGGTSFEAAFNGIVEVLKANVDDPFITSAAVVFLTDGHDMSNIPRQQQVASLRRRLQDTWPLSKPIVVHTIGLGNGHDHQFLTDLAHTGSMDGAYRFADPGEDTDSLSGKMNGVFSALGSGAGFAPFSILSTTGFEVVRMNGVNDKEPLPMEFWVRATKTTSATSAAAAALRIQFDDAEHDVAMTTVVAEDDANAKLWNEWYSYTIDEIANEVYGLATTTQKEEEQEVRDLHILLLQQRSRAILVRIQDHPSNEVLVLRLQEALANLTQLRAGGSVDIRKLNDARYEGRFATVRTSKPNDTLGSAKAITTNFQAKRAITQYHIQSYTYRQERVFRAGAAMDEIFRLLGCAKTESIIAYLEANPEATAINYKGNSLIALSACTGRLRFQEYLVAKCCSPGDRSQKNDFGETALDMAILRGNYKTVELLHRNGFVIGLPVKTLLLNCILGRPQYDGSGRVVKRRQYFKTAEYLIRVGMCVVEDDLFMYAPNEETVAWLTAHKNEALSPQAKMEMALIRGFPDILLEVREHAISTKFSWKSYMHLLEQNKPNFVEIVRILVDEFKIADVDEQINGGPDTEEPECGDVITWPLFIASIANNTAMIRFLLDRISENDAIAIINRQNQRGTTALWIASYKRNMDVAMELLNRGADPNICNRKGDSCLIPAIQMGSDTMVDLLLTAGCRWDLFNRNRDTPVILACRNGQATILESLLNKMSSEEEIANALSVRASIDGYDALTASAELNKERCVRVCHRFGAKLEARTEDNCPAEDLRGATALHVAAYYGQISCVQTLVELGADVNAQLTSNGNTALHLAVRKGHGILVGVLLHSLKADKTIFNNENHFASYYASPSMMEEFFADPLERPLTRMLSAPATVREAMANVLAVYGRSRGSYEYDNITSVRCGDSGVPILSRALLHGHTNLVRTLVETMGANPSQCDDRGLTPAFWAHLLYPKDGSGVPQNPTALKQLQRVRKVQESGSLQTKMILDLKVAAAITTDVDVSSNSDNNNNNTSLARMSCGFASVVDSTTMNALAVRSEPMLMNFMSRILSGRFVSLRHEAQVHIISMLATNDEHSLTAAQMLAIYLFTSNQTIQQYVCTTMSDWKQQSLWHPYVQCLHQAVRALPPFVGELYRGIDTIVSNPEAYAVGTEIRWDGFNVCSSQWAAVSSLITEKRGLAFVIHSRTCGRKLGVYAKTPVDEEALILPGTSFRVVQRYVGKVFVFSQPNIRHTLLLTEESEIERVRTGKMCMVVEMEEI
jgi:ankyrin repeat protein/Mg-chelatase subunit ChlD